MNLKQYAARLGVAHGTLKRWVHEGLPVIRDWSFGDDAMVYVPTDVADAWVAEHYPTSIAYNRVAFVYFARRLTGDIKIGWTSDPVRRLREIRKRDKGTELIGYIPGDKPLELEWHARFSRLRLDGEWFRPANELLTTIREALDLADCG